MNGVQEVAGSNPAAPTICATTGSRRRTSRRFRLQAWSPPKTAGFLFWAEVDSVSSTQGRANGAPCATPEGPCPTSWSARTDGCAAGSPARPLTSWMTRQPEPGRGRRSLRGGLRHGPWRQGARRRGNERADSEASRLWGWRATTRGATLTVRRPDCAPGLGRCQRGSALTLRAERPDGVARCGPAAGATRRVLATVLRQLARMGSAPRRWEFAFLSSLLPSGQSEAGGWGRASRAVMS